ncbi:MAG: hypothetical protein Q7R84_01820 [bacterium]|nr:hypothetical protein [bacterium]
MSRQGTKIWRKNNLLEWRKERNRTKQRRQQETQCSAVNAHQPWTDQELKYLEKEGRKKTIKELAIKLGRSHLAVQGVAHKHGIVLFSPEKASGLCNR